MKLTPEQKQAVTSWIAAGEGLSAVQKRLADEFQISMTYMDVRFLVDDLGLELVEAPKKRSTAPTDLSQGPAHQPAPPPDEDDALPTGSEGFDEVADEAPISGVKVDTDALIRPGAMISGTASFSDGQTAKWAIDQHGRLLFDPATKGYRPSQQDLQDFQLELQAVLERKGMY
jgi:hypothetical protein